MAWVVVCVHDVCPSQREGVRWLLEALDGLGAVPRVLLVVPEEGGSASIAEDPDVVRWLWEEHKRGSEVVLHGYTHRTAGALRGSVLTRWRARWFAPHDAEFASLSETEMEARIRAGRRMLEALGVHVHGFCPPGWLWAPELPGVLRRLGFRYLLGMGTLLDLRAGRKQRIPWLGDGGVGGVHEVLLGLGSLAGLALAHLPLPAVTVFFHPQRVFHSSVARARLMQLSRLLRRRRPTTYHDLLRA